MRKKLQVFVSSTYKDLLPERQAAVEAILVAGHIPAGMELFAAGDKSQLDTIKRWIDASDVFMLVLGGRYGSIEPESGKSYVQLEYEYAVAKGKPFFAIVVDELALDEKVKAHGANVLELQHRDLYESFRKLVVSKVCRFFSDAKDLKLGVLESLSNIAADLNLPGWVRSDEVSDPAPMLEEMKQLRAENTTLKKSIADLQRKLQAEEFGGMSFDELLAILHKEKVDATGLVGPGEDKHVALPWVMLAMSDILVVGVDNRIGMSNQDKFLFFKVLPRLALYGLAEKGKPNAHGVQHFQMSELGRRFLGRLRQRYDLGRPQIQPPPQPSASPKPKSDTAQPKSDTAPKRTGKATQPKRTKRIESDK